MPVTVPEQLPRDSALPLDDDELLLAFLVFIGWIDTPGVPTARAAKVARTLFLEIANRWLPSEPLRAAFERLGEEDEALIAALDDPAFAAKIEQSIEDVAHRTELTLVPSD